MAIGVTWHLDLNVRQATALGDSPLKCCNRTILFHGSCVDDDIFQKSHEAGFRVTGGKVVSIYDRIVGEVGSRLEDGWIIRIAHDDCSHTEVERVPKLIDSTRKEDFGGLS